MHGGNDAAGAGLRNPYFPCFPDVANGVFSPAAPASASATATAAPASYLVRRKRGRPRKYGASVPLLQPHSASVNMSSSKEPVTSPGSSSLPRKNEGAASSKKAQLAALGTAGQGFTPHLIRIAPGENVAHRIMSFMQECKWTVCILSAFGSIAYASLRQPAILGGNVTYEGMFEILSLSGSLLQNNDGGMLRTGGLSICLSGADGRIVGGVVGGPLLAASPVQVIAASFFIDTASSVNTSHEVDDSAGKLSLPFFSGGATTPATLPLTSESSIRIMNIRDSNDGQRLSGSGRSCMPHSQTVHAVQNSTGGSGGSRENVYSSFSQLLPTDGDD